MGRVILPQGVRSVEPKPLRCLLCEEEFTLSQQGVWIDHVARCVAEHAQEIQDSRPSVREAGTVWDPEEWDPEAEAYMLRVGERMRREKRLELKPGEGLG